MRGLYKKVFFFYLKQCIIIYKIIRGENMLGTIIGIVGSAISIKKHLKV